jgi:hypothetical protein
MRRLHVFRMIGLALVVGLALGWSCPAQAQNALVRVKSVDSLLESAKYLAKMAGQEAQADQLEGLLHLVTGGKGLAGVDRSRPAGIFANLTAGGGQPIIVFVPVSDPDKLLDLLRSLNVKVEGSGDTLIELKPQKGDTSYLRFEKDYAFASPRLDLLQGELPDLSRFAPLPNDGTLVNAQLDIRQLPYEFRQLGLAALRKQALDQLEKDSSRKLGESDAAHRGRLAASRYFTERGLRLLEELHGLTATLKVDSKSHLATLEVGLEVNPKSEVGRSIEQFAQSKSVFAAFGQEAGLHGLFSVPVAIELQSLLRTGFRDETQKALDKESDPRKRELGARLQNVLDRALFPDRYDIASAIRGPFDDGQFVILFGMRVPSAKELEAVLIDVAKEFAPPADQATIELGHGRHGPTAIHRIRFPESRDGTAERLYGAAELFLAYRDEIVLAAFGQRGGEVLPRVLDDLERPADPDSSPIQLDVRLSRVGPLAVDDAGRRFRDAVAEYSRDNPDRDRIRLSLTGGSALKLRLELDTHLLQLVSKLKPN